MKRTLTVIVLAGAALALLVGAALKSRSIPLETHIARYTMSSDIARLQDEFSTLRSSLESAWQANQAPGEAASSLRDRLVASTANLAASASLMPGTTAQRGRIENSLIRLNQTMDTVANLTTTLLQEQTAYSQNLTLLREGGAEVTRQLRAIGETRTAADLFQLIAETIDYAAPGRQIGEFEIRRLLVTLQRDQRIDGGIASIAGPTLAAILSILDTKDGIQSRLSQLASISLNDYATELDQATATAYQSAVSSADRARTMLSIYAVVMLLCVGLIALRLRSSYSALNRANDELGELNESLEQRVQERTEDLSSALYELKESQVQLVQAEKMSSLGQLVAGISHEINTPLLYLANNASLIKERMEAVQEFVTRSSEALGASRSEKDDRGDYQDRLIKGLKSMKLMLRELELEASVQEVVDLNDDSIEGLVDLTEMAQSLKDFSRLDRAPIDSFDVNSGIDKTLNIARNIVKHKAEVKKFYGDIPNIECSPSKINQVFLNLITNAAQAIEDQGEIVISTKLHDADHLAIAIADTGCGIPEENLAKIRDPFFTTKEVGTGTGLGLSIVDEIIRSHGGEMIVESTVGQGSTFTVILPLKQPRNANSPADGEEFDSAFAEAV